MKVYRIKHKPSGLYYSYKLEQLTDVGDILGYNPMLSTGDRLLVVANIDSFQLKNKDADIRFFYISFPEEMIVKEYDLED